MDPYGDDARASQTLLVATPDSPVATPAEVEAWKARKAYPSMLIAGGPVFGVARERTEGGWELHPSFGELAPQDARDSLGHHFRLRSQEAGAAGDTEAEAEFLAAAERLDWEALDEVALRGSRYRVVRAERFIRMGPDGPEPPRATDPDPAGPGGPGGRTSGFDPAAGLVIDPAGATGRSEGILKAELLTALRRNGTVPADVRDDSLAAARTHPGGVLLPATFGTAERQGSCWYPQSSGTAVTPQEARDALALHLRVVVPWQHDLTAEEREAHNGAADRLDAQGCDELQVAGRHFRIVRVERLVRMGPDGPEGPRPSDADPVPPAMVHDQQLREQERHGPIADDDAHDERAQRFLVLFDEERRRRRALSRADRTA